MTSTIRQTLGSFVAEPDRLDDNLDRAPPRLMRVFGSSHGTPRALVRPIVFLYFFSLHFAFLNFFPLAMCARSTSHERNCSTRRGESHFIRTRRCVSEHLGSTRHAKDWINQTLTRPFLMIGSQFTALFFFRHSKRRRHGTRKKRRPRDGQGPKGDTQQAHGRVHNNNSRGWHSFFFQKNKEKKRDRTG